MTLTRRRFLTISAAGALLPGAAQSETWRGIAFGADVSISLQGPHDEVSRALAVCRADLRHLERVFSLYDPASELSRLNSAGRTNAPSADLHRVFRLSDRLHAITRGAFDPTIQTLWRAHAQGSDISAAAHTVGWPRVAHNALSVRLVPDQALSFNGIAQGDATDQIADRLSAMGFEDVLVNIGEYRSTGGSWQIGLADPAAGILGKHTLTRGALATSSPSATRVGGAAHILHPHRAPQWSSVTVAAQTASLADGLSTAFVLCTEAEIRAAAAVLPGVSAIYLTDTHGDLRRI